MAHVKPLLAVSALLVFGRVVAIASDPRVRAIASFVMFNALLCHVMGCVEWDVACNAGMAAFLAATVCNKSELLLLGLVGMGAWWANHHVSDSAFVHAICVQGLGATALLRCRFR